MKAPLSLGLVLAITPSINVTDSAGVMALPSHCGAPFLKDATILPSTRMASASTAKFSYQIQDYCSKAPLTLIS